MTLLPAGPVTFQQFLEIVYEQRYTGSTLVHFHGGIARFVDTGRPIRITLQPGPKSEGLTAGDAPPHTPD